MVPSRCKRMLNCNVPVRQVYRRILYHFTPQNNGNATPQCANVAMTGANAAPIRCTTFLLDHGHDHENRMSVAPAMAAMHGGSDVLWPNRISNINTTSYYDHGLPEPIQHHQPNYLEARTTRPPPPTKLIHIIIPFALNFLDTVTCAINATIKSGAALVMVITILLDSILTRKSLDELIRSNQTLAYSLLYLPPTMSPRLLTFVLPLLLRLHAPRFPRWLATHATLSPTAHQAPPSPPALFVLVVAM